MRRDENILNVIIGLIVVLGTFVGWLSNLFRKLREPKAGEADGESSGSEPEAPPTPRPRVRPARRREPPAAAVHRTEEAAPESPAAEAPVPRPAIRPRRTLDDLVFANRRYSPGAKLVLAREILDGPRGRRGRR